MISDVRVQGEGFFPLYVFMNRPVQINYIFNFILEMMQK